MDGCETKREIIRKFHRVNIYSSTVGIRTTYFNSLQTGGRKVKKRIFALMMAMVFLFSQVSIVDAKARSGGGFSSKSSSGYSGSSRKSSGISSFGSSKSSSSTKKSSSGYSGSSTRSVPNSYSKASPSSSKGSAAGTGSSQTSGTAASSTKSNTLKNAYMEDAYKKQASGMNYKAYQQKMNDAQKKAYDSSFNKSYKVNDRMNFDDAMKTRSQRISSFDRRPVRMYVNNSYFGGPLSYGSAFIGPWDLFFLMTASDLFWYHHWNDIYPNREYFDAAKFAEMEARVKALEVQNNNVRDPDYLDPDVDPDLQFSKEYTEKNLDNVYLSNKYARPAVDPFFVFIIIFAVGAVMVIVIRIVSKPKPKTGFKSRIY